MIRESLKSSQDEKQLQNLAHDGFHTVDGRICQPVEVGSLPRYLDTGFYTSQVVQDFFHQQYGNQSSSSEDGHPLSLSIFLGPGIQTRWSTQLYVCKCTYNILVYVQIDIHRTE